MPDEPKRPPVPDALRNPAPVPAPRPLVDMFRDPLNPVETQPAVPVEPKEGDEEKKPAPPSGLGDLDAPHAFLSVLGSGFGRVAAVLAICILAFGITDACHHASLLVAGWRAGGIGGFFQAVLAVPGSLLASPGRWFYALGTGLTESLLAVPYLMLVIGGIILAVRSEIRISSLLLFYGLLTALHTALLLKMTNVFSILLWLGAVRGLVWLWVWLRRQYEPDAGPEAPPETDPE